MMKFIPQIVLVILPLLWLLSAARAAVVVTAFPQALVLVDLDTIQGSQLPVDLNSDGTVDFTIAYRTSQFLGLRTEGLNRLAVELAPPEYRRIAHTVFARGYSWAQSTAIWRDFAIVAHTCGPR